MAWGAFFVIWLVGSYSLHLAEYDAERTAQKEFNNHAANVVTKLEAIAAGKGLESDLDDLLSWLVDHGNCVVNEPGELDWDMWGALIFLLSVATSIGYGHFSVTRGAGQVLTVVFSAVLLPLLICAFKFSTDLISAVIKRSPGYPKTLDDGRMMDSTLRKAGYTLLWISAVLGAWIVAVGALLISTLLDEDRTVGEGLYFGWITLSTIGFGDFVFHMKETKGVGVVFVLVGLPLFSTSISALISFVALCWNRLVVALHASFGGKSFSNLSVEQLRSLRLQKASKLYTDDELLLAATAFSIVDTFNGDDDGTLDIAELKTMLLLIGACEAVGLSDGGGGSSGDPGAEEDLVEYLLATADPLGVGSEVDGKHVNVSAGLEPGTFLLLLAPFFTVLGHRNEVHKGLAACVLNWVVAGVFVALGGWLLSAIEGSAEDERVESWDAILKSHASDLDLDGERSLSAMVEHLVDKGVCSIPECEVYESKEVEKEKDLFRCNTYHRTWDFEGAAFFCCTIISTIGFGSFTPQTTAGIAATVGLSLPGLILFSAALGSLLEMPSLLAEFWHVHFNPDDPNNKKQVPRRRLGRRRRGAKGRKAKRKTRAGKFGGGAGRRSGASERGPPVALALEEAGGVVDVADEVRFCLGMGAYAEEGLHENEQKEGLPHKAEQQGTGGAGVVHGNHEDEEVDDHPTNFALGVELREDAGNIRGVSRSRGRDDEAVVAPPSVGSAEAQEEGGGKARVRVQMGGLESEQQPSVAGGKPQVQMSRLAGEKRLKGGGGGGVNWGGAEPASSSYPTHDLEPKRRLLPSCEELQCPSDKCGSASCPTKCGNYSKDFRWGVLCAVVLAATTFLFAFVLENDNGWTVDESAYFTWIACTTIGLGDYAPSDDSMHWSILILPAGLALVGRVIGSLDSLISDALAAATNPNVRVTEDLTPVKRRSSSSLLQTTTTPFFNLICGASKSLTFVEPPPTHERLLMALDAVRDAEVTAEAVKRTQAMIDLVRGAGSGSGSSGGGNKMTGAPAGAPSATVELPPLSRVNDDASPPHASFAPAAVPASLGAASPVKSEDVASSVRNLRSASTVSEEGADAEAGLGSAAAGAAKSVGVSFALMPDALGNMSVDMPDVGASLHGGMRSLSVELPLDMANTLPDMGNLGVGMGSAANLPDLSRLSTDLGDLSLSRMGNLGIRFNVGSPAGSDRSVPGTPI